MDKLLFFVVSCLFCSGIALAHQGTVAFWNETNQPVAVKVELPQFEGDLLRNQFVQFTALPEGIRPDGDGNFFYPMDDIRFAYVHTLYHVNRMVQEYNTLLAELGIEAIQNVKIELRPMSPTEFPGGSTQSDWLYVRYLTPVIDISILDHEIGHFIDNRIHGKHSNSAIPISDFGPKEFRSYSAEGVPNILAALHLGVSQIGKYDFLDGAWEMDQYFDIKSSLPTDKDLIKKLVNKSPLFSERYPQLTNWLKTADLGEGKGGGVDFYAASSLFTQPIWQASKIFDRKKIQKILLMSLLQSKQSERSLNLIFSLLTRNAEALGEREIQEFFSKAGRLRIIQD